MKNNKNKALASKIKSIIVYLSFPRNNHEVHLISTSRLMMAYGLGQDIALLRTSLQSFNSLNSLAGQTVKFATYCIKYYCVSHEKITVLLYYFEQQIRRGVNFVARLYFLLPSSCSTISKSCWSYSCYIMVILF